MSSTAVNPSERALLRTQIETLVNSSTLHGSESLCKLLRYLAEHALEHPGTPPKEYQLATEVFGRPADFDPHVDSTIRVQAGRLRVKLAEYYGSLGASDPIVVELPKGSYALAYHRRALAVPTLATVGIPIKAATAASSGNATEFDTGWSERRPWMLAVTALSVLLAVAVAAIGSLLASRNAPASSAAGKIEPAPPAFRTFWKPFIAGPEAPWMIFSNAVFLGRPETGMRYYRPGADPAGPVLDHYTGVGEVLAVHELDRVFGQLQHPIRVKRGSLFSLDDAKNNNLIFIGSPSENLTLLEIPGSQEFVFQRVTSGPRKGDLAVVNLHPQAGEAEAYLATPSGQAQAEDYAVVALEKGINPTQSVLILAGTTTIGTQAAVEYVCRQNSVQDLLQRLSVSDSNEIKPFEAVLRVKVIRGVPVETVLVALRKRAP